MLRIVAYVDDCNIEFNSRSRLDLKIKSAGAINLADREGTLDVKAWNYEFVKKEDIDWEGLDWDGFTEMIG